YHIFKHIDEASFLRKKERVKYAKLVRAQLSSIESGALMLNGLSSKGVKSKVYIEKYSLLQGFTLSKSFKNELKSAGAMRLYNPVA
ncbi:putative phage abortive infection protein, partial [Enterobacter hormaechei]|uniref:putative phage abortive infection protein n=2 Tax=Enterobacter TaxID=547 RepID=UPI001F098C72